MRTGGCRKLCRESERERRDVGYCCSSRTRENIPSPRGLVWELSRIYVRHCTLPPERCNRPAGVEATIGDKADNAHQSGGLLYWAAQRWAGSCCTSSIVLVKLDWPVSTLAPASVQSLRGHAPPTRSSLEGGSARRPRFMTVRA